MIQGAMAMNTMNDIEVIINNKRYTICGYESAEYLQKVASYINNKHTEFKLKDFYNKLDQDMRNILLEINIADDYFKAKRQVKELEEDHEAKSKEIFDLKHELISTQTRRESLQKELQALKFDHVEAQKKIVKLETEMDERGLRK
jgi:cell division protein ZapA